MSSPTNNHAATARTAAIVRCPLRFAMNASNARPKVTRNPPITSGDTSSAIRGSFPRNTTKTPTFIHHSTAAVPIPFRPRIDGGRTTETIETFERGDEVSSKLPGGSTMTVLAVEGLKVRCSDDQGSQYWFDTNLLERYHWIPPGPEAIEQDSLTAICPELHSNSHRNVTSLI